MINDKNIELQGFLLDLRGSPFLPGPLPSAVSTVQCALCMTVLEKLDVLNCPNGHSWTKMSTD